MQFEGQHLLLLPQRAIFWEEQNMLMVSDLHIGKVGHFRKSGIAIPRGMEQEDLAVLSDLLHTFKPGRLLFLGDLFHSEHNNDWEWLSMWRAMHSGVEMILVQGNHDILQHNLYAQAGIVVTPSLKVEEFNFCHEPEDCKSEGFHFCGHIHPAVRLNGLARQSDIYSCFYFSRNMAILPAFGRFTGNSRIKVRRGERVFIIAGDKVLEI